RHGAPPAGDDQLAAAGADPAPHRHASRTIHSSLSRRKVIRSSVDEISLDTCVFIPPRASPSRTGSALLAGRGGKLSSLPIPPARKPAATTQAPAGSGVLVLRAGAGARRRRPRPRRARP